VSTEVKKEIELEIAYVLFIDIVGYSKLVTHEQRRLLELLNQIVHETKHFRAAEAKGRLITVPTGDGMALVFYNTPEAPVECALEVNSAASEHPELKLRMGVHSGPISGVVDVSGRSNIAGAGINMAQRVMDCGDAGPHPCVQTHGRRLGTIRAVETPPTRFGRMRSEAWDARVYCESLRGRSRQSATAKKVSSAEKAQCPIALDSGDGDAACTCGNRRCHRNVFPLSRAIDADTPGKSIAVLPFENLSEDKANAYFADGVQTKS
jgi:hypothetical protein